MIYLNLKISVFYVERTGRVEMFNQIFSVNVSFSTVAPRLIDVFVEFVESG